MTLRKTLVYFLIFTSLAAIATYKIVISAYENEGRYDIENLKSQALN